MESIYILTNVTKFDKEKMLTLSNLWVIMFNRKGFI